MSPVIAIPKNGCFNSIKVRLNPTIHSTYGEDVMFQFHKGTIKPFTQLQTKLQGMLFQFHKGTIKPTQGHLDCDSLEVSIP